MLPALPSTETKALLRSVQMLRSTCYHLQIAIVLLLIGQTVLIDLSKQHSQHVFYSTASFAAGQSYGIDLQPQNSFLGPTDQQQSSPSDFALRAQQQSDGRSLAMKDRSRLVPNHLQQQQSQVPPSNDWLPPSQTTANQNLIVQNPGNAQQNYANPRLDQQFNATSPQSSHNLDLLIEGSGSGPVSRHSTEKFDDTEEGDDDDDEDYDYKDTLDSGSGHGKEASAAKKADSPLITSNNIIKSPEVNESNLYLPFRHPTTFGLAVNKSTTATIITQPTTKINVPSTTFAPPIKEVLKIPSNSKQDTDLPNDNNGSSSPRKEIHPPVEEMKSDSSSPTLQSESTQPNLLLSAQKVADGLKQSVNMSGSSTLPSRLLESQLKLLNNNAPRNFSNSTPTKFSPQSSQNSTISSHFNNSGVDYDYEDDKEDDDSEDVANFEDNDLSDNVSADRTSTVNSTTSLAMVPRPQNGSRLTLPILISTTPMPKFSYPFSSPAPARPSFNFSSSSNFAQTVSKHPVTHHESPYTTTTTAGPDSASRPSAESDNEDEDNDDEDEDDEEFYEDTDDGEEDGDLTFDSNPSRVTNVIKSTGDIPTSSSRWTTTKSPKIIANHYDPMNENRPRNAVVSTTSAPAPVTTFPSSPTLPSSEFPSIIHPPVTIASTRPSGTILNTKTTVLPTTTSMTSVAPIYTPATMRPTPTPIRYATTQRDRVAPAISKTSDILTYERGSKDDDIDLTKQIYDKAVEMYQATYKAIHVAVETVWPPTFNLNSNTFEPLLAHSLLFMLALGGAVIALVLTMMLVVYIINYQIQPKEDDISIY